MNNEFRLLPDYINIRENNIKRHLPRHWYSSIVSNNGASCLVSVLYIVPS